MDLNFSLNEKIIVIPRNYSINFKLYPSIMTHYAFFGFGCIYVKFNSMKKGFLMILCVFSFCNIHAQIVFQSEDQRWTVTGVVSNDDYTAIYCDITILNNKGGCFDVHDFDKNTKIYISGEFGEHKLISSQYEGYYKPWYRYTNITNWNYYYPGNKNKVAHATFYFARIPAGVSHIKWSFYGGRGISLFKKRRNYQCPTFVINNLQVQNNPMDRRKITLILEERTSISYRRYL